jgi:hypothetical protein
MTNLPEEVILDLLPLYFAGEASTASAELVDSYFEAHPHFARTMRAVHNSSPQVPGNAAPNEGHAAIRRVKMHMIARAVLIAIGVFCTISPFTFIYANQQLKYFMWRDAPASAAAYAGVAALTWIALTVLIRRTNVR